MVDSQYAGGVSPIGVIEPFNQYQLQGLTGLANMQYNRPSAMGFMNGAQSAYQQALQSRPDINGMFNQGNQFYTQGGQAINQGLQGLTDQGFQQGISRYMNPYENEVVNRTLSDLGQQGDIARSKLTSGMSRPGSRSFGDTSGAMQLSNLAKDLFQQQGNTAAQLRYQGYNDATSNTLNQFNAEANRNIQGGQALGGLGGQRTNEGFQGLNALQNLVNTAATGNQMNWFNANQGNALLDKENQNKLAAGGAIQNQNQRLLDVVTGEQNALRNNDLTKLSQLAQLLGAFPNSSSGSGTSSQGGDVGNIAGLAKVFGSFFS